MAEAVRAFARWISGWNASDRQAGDRPGRGGLLHALGVGLAAIALLPFAAVLWTAAAAARWRWLRPASLERLLGERPLEVRRLGRGANAVARVTLGGADGPRYLVV